MSISVTFLADFWWCTQWTCVQCTAYCTLYSFVLDWLKLQELIEPCGAQFIKLLISNRATFYNQVSSLRAIISLFGNICVLFWKAITFILHLPLPLPQPPCRPVACSQQDPTGESARNIWALFAGEHHRPGELALLEGEHHRPELATLQATIASKYIYLTDPVWPGLFYKQLRP